MTLKLPPNLKEDILAAAQGKSGEAGGADGEEFNVLKVSVSTRTVVRIIRVRDRVRVRVRVRP